MTVVVTKKVLHDKISRDIVLFFSLYKIFFEESSVFFVLINVLMFYSTIYSILRKVENKIVYG